jgi:hypothetical protein
MDYKTTQKEWERFASIRTKPTRVVELDGGRPHFYPIRRQPLCLHPIVKKMGEDALKIILIHAAYKFMRDIAFIETEVVNNIAIKIAANKLPIKFPESLRQDALTIIIDETYHAYVAQDFIRQVEALTGILSLQEGEETNLFNAISVCKAKLPVHLRDYFELIAVCIGENSITQELVKITEDQSTNKVFYQVNADHAIDEGRHSRIFKIILKHTWETLDKKDRVELAKILPEFLRLYLRQDTQIAYDKVVLQELKLPEKEIEKVLSDTHIAYTKETFGQVNPIVRNIITLLEKTNVLSDKEVKDIFVDEHLIEG